MSLGGATTSFHPFAGFLNQWKAESFAELLRRDAEYLLRRGQVLRSNARETMIGVMQTIETAVANQLAHALSPENCTSARTCTKHCDSSDFHALMHEKREHNENIEKYYELKGKHFAAGGFGEIYLAKDKQSGHTVAVKKVKIHNDRKTKEACLREIRIMKELDHPNICKLLDAFITEEYIFLVMEYCSGGELFDYIAQNSGLPEPVAADIASQVAGALCYAHSRGIAHRDIKPENIIFCTSEPGDTRVKVIDWGLSAFARETVMKTAVGSLSYAAPEVLKPGTVYGCECDVWSLGVVTYIMHCAKPPFWGNMKSMLQRMEMGSYPMDGAEWESVSEEAKEFIQSCFVFDPKQRCSIEDLTQHKWLQRHANN